MWGVGGAAGVGCIDMWLKDCFCHEPTERYFCLQQIHFCVCLRTDNPLSFFPKDPTLNDQESRRAKRASLMLCLCCAIAACGGGAVDESQEPVSVPLVSAAPMSDPLASAPSVQPAVPVTVTVTVSAAIAASCQSSGSSVFQAEVLQRVNAVRAAGAVCGAAIYPAASALNWNSLIQQAASGHSSDMAQNNYFSHDSLNGKTFAQRLTDAGYNYSAAGENIAAGDLTVEQVVNHWLNSPGHCVNMMNPTYRDIGVACASNNSSSYRNYWTMDLGR